MDAVDAAAFGPFKKYAHGHGRYNDKSLICFGCDFSGWCNFGKKSLKLLPPDVMC